MIKMQSPRKNKLLKDLPVAEYECVFPHLELIQMSLGEVLFESGEKLQYLYFPTNCFASLFSDAENGSSTEIASVGNDGAVGVAIFLSGTAIYRAVVQSPGYTYRMRKNRVMQQFNQHGSLFHKLLNYTQSLITYTAQTAVCNRFHTVDQRLCRFLLVSLDRLPSNELNYLRQSRRLIAGAPQRGCLRAAKAAPTYPISTDHNVHLPFPDLGYTL
jgi:hypothetical protein